MRSRMAHANCNTGGMHSYHLLPEGDGWKLVQAMDGRIEEFETKEEGVRRSREIVQERSGSLVIHGEDGSIEEERTYPRSADSIESPG